MSEDPISAEIFEIEVRAIEKARTWVAEYHGDSLNGRQVKDIVGNVGMILYAALKAAAYDSVANGLNDTYPDIAAAIREVALANAETENPE